MHQIVLDQIASWRVAARALAIAGVPPEQVTWSFEPHAEPLLPDAPDPQAIAAFRLPRALVELIDAALQAAAPERFDALYRLLWRAHHGERNVMENAGDPEVQAAHGLARPQRIAAYRATVTAQPDTLAAAASEARACRLCPLWAPASRTVFGEGVPGARLMLVGEQPGDQEDLAGRPFVGPAGQMLDRALAEAGIDRAQVYVTNAVKHFKFVRRGARRIHERPGAGEIEACRFWLDLERAAVAPALLLLLGATAAQAVLRRAVTIGRERGKRIALPDGGAAFVTVHPSYLLRLPDEAARAREYAAFVTDLRAAAALVGRRDEHSAP